MLRCGAVDPTSLAGPLWQLVSPGATLLAGGVFFSSLLGLPLLYLAASGPRSLLMLPSPQFGLMAVISWARDHGAHSHPLSESGPVVSLGRAAGNGKAWQTMNPECPVSVTPGLLLPLVCFLLQNKNHSFFIKTEKQPEQEQKGTQSTWSRSLGSRSPPDPEAT